MVPLPVARACRHRMAHAATSSFSAAESAQTDTDLDAQKRGFLRMISHELRTPLNSILGFSEILASELYGPLGSPQYKEYAEIIHGSGRRLLKLVNQVLEIARLDGRAIDFNLRAEPLEPTAVPTSGPSCAACMNSSASIRQKRSTKSGPSQRRRMPCSMVWRSLIIEGHCTGRRRASPCLTCNSG